MQIFWRLAYLTESVADHFLRALRSELDWLRNALRFAVIAAPQGSPRAVPADHLGALRLVLDYWVIDQHNFYEKRARHDHRALKRLVVAGWTLFSLGLALPLLEMIFGAAPTRLREMNLSPAASAIALNLLLVLRLAPQALPLLYLYGKIMCLAEHVKQYRQASFLFNTAAEHLRQLLDEGNVAAAQRLVLELGKEVLQENGNWVLLHRRRPIKPPKVG